MSEAAARYRALVQAVAATAQAAGRRPDSVRLVVAAKGQAVRDLAAVWDAGARDFGANLAQELGAQRRGLEAGRRPARWHFIGSLQRNKVARVCRDAEVVQVLDRAALLPPLARAAGAGPPRALLLQVASGGGPGRGGIAWGEAAGLLADAAGHRGLRVVGLMVVADPAAPPEQVFAQVATLAGELRRAPGGAHLRELSMGMSGDWPAAVRHGATLVRLGTAIFGAGRAR